MLNIQILKRFQCDTPLLTLLSAIGLMSLIVLFSAGGESFNIVKHQGIRLGLAFGLMLLIAQVSPRVLQTWTPWIYGVGLILLVCVALFGDASKGAQRWLEIGPVRFQPAELMKLAVPMMVAWWYRNKALPPNFNQILIGFALLGVPALMIAKQPDLGTALVVAFAGMVVIFLAGIAWKYLIFGAASAISALPILWSMMHDYQRQRVLTFVNPERDPLGSGYHIIQSKIAVGSGGIFGKGWLEGTQAQLEFLPERTTDFIVAVMGEEFGFLGVATLITLYLLVVFRGLKIAANAHDTFTRLLSGALAITFFIYAFVNIGMVTGILPVVGLPLPMMSFGGTSLVTIMSSFGIIMSIHAHRQFVHR